MLKIIFLSLFLSTYSFAGEEAAQAESSGKDNGKIFKNSSLTNKDSKEDNINVLPFYTVKELKDSKKEDIKINKEEIKTLNQFKVALADKKKKLEDAESTLKYFQEMYASKKLDNKRTILELKWSLRVIAKRKDAIVRLNKRYKQSMDLASLELDQYQNEIESEKVGKDLMGKLENEIGSVSASTESAKSKNDSFKNGPVVTGNIQKDQQTAYKFYKNKTYKDVITKNQQSNKSSVVVEPVQPQAVVKEMTVEPIVSKSESNPAVDSMVKEQAKTVPTAKEQSPISPIVTIQAPIAPLVQIEPKKEIEVSPVSTKPQVMDTQKSEIELKPKEVLVDKKEVVDQLEAQPEVISEVKTVVSPIIDQPKNEVAAPKKEEIIPSASESAQLKETLEIVNLKMSQQKIEQEYNNLLEKYKKLELEAKEKEIKQAQKDDISAKNKEAEKVPNIVIIDEKQKVQPEKKEEIGKVKINSIKEQLNGDVGAQESHLSGDAGSDKDEDVMYYRGNGIEEEGSMEESEGPAY